MVDLQGFFKPQEVEGLNDDFVQKLVLSRKFAGIPYIITSGLRTPTSQQSIPGAVSDSSHLVGKAVDLRVSNDHEVYLIVAASLSAGIVRFGIYIDENNVPTHVHIDDDNSKPQECIWIRKEGVPYNSSPVTA